MDKCSSSFDNKFNKLQIFIKTSYSVKSFSCKFTSLKKSHEKIGMAYQVLEEANILPDCVVASPKCFKESAVLREKGNKEFLRKKDLLALQTYSESVALAPIDSVELALAFANRSAVTQYLKEYKACINDIDRALAGKYPEHLLHKLYERKGKCLACLGMNRSAKESFQVT